MKTNIKTTNSTTRTSRIAHSPAVKKYMDLTESNGFQWAIGLLGLATLLVLGFYVLVMNVSTVANSVPEFFFNEYLLVGVVAVSSLFILWGIFTFTVKFIYERPARACIAAQDVYEATKDNIMRHEDGRVPSEPKTREEWEAYLTLAKEGLRISKMFRTQNFDPALYSLCKSALRLLKYAEFNENGIAYTP